MDSPLLTLPLPHLTVGKASSATLLAQIAHAAKDRASKSRAERNALYRRKKFLHSLPEGCRSYYAENRYAECLPRAYAIRFTDPIADCDDADLQKLNGQTIVFGQHWSNDSGVLLNGHQVHPDTTSFVPATKTFSFSTHLKHTPAVPRNDIGAYFSFEAAQPSGFLAVGSRAFNVKLDPKKVWYDVNVSANAGAYFSSGDQKLIWNSNSDDWKNATWENGAMTFGYDVKNIGDELQAQWVAENTFVDNSITPSTTFELVASHETFPTQYISTMASSTSKGSLMVTKVLCKPPEPPASRKDLLVKSVFPRRWEIQFSPFADQFTGSYEDWNGNVYAVSGTLKLEDDASLFSILSAPRHTLPVEDLYAESSRSEHSINVHSTAPRPEALVAGNEGSIGLHSPHPEKLSMGAAANIPDTVPSKPELKVFEILNLNPMVQDTDDPSGYRDSVAQKAMADFHDLIVYFMDEDLRSTFVQKTAPVLPEHVLAIAQDDATLNNSANRTFYQKLQVPYIVSILSRGTMEHADQCNGARANAQLKDIPAQDEVYKRHSAKLYRARFIEKFPSIADFLKDQRENPRRAMMDKFAAKMKSNIKAKSEGMKDGNKDYEKNLARALQDVDNLIDWAKERSLYWALELLYWVQNASLPNWFAQYTTGGSSATLSMNLKQLNALFGLLENNAINSKPDGRNFMQVFNENMRLFQMTSVLPHLVDIDGNLVAFDNLLVQCLEEYINNFKASLDQNHIEAINYAMKLHEDRDLRFKLWQPLAVANRMSMAMTSWAVMAERWEFAVVNSDWFKKISWLNVKAFKFFAGAVTGCFILSFFLPIYGDFGKRWTTSEKVQWGLTLGGVCGFLGLKFMQGLFRFATFGENIADRFQALYCIAGWEKVIDNIEGAAQRYEGTLTGFFTRTTKQTLALADEEVSTGVSKFTMVERLLGRNLGEVLTTVVGLALAVVSLVLTSIDIAQAARDHDWLLLAMDIIMIISSIVQVLAVAAGMIMAYGAVAAAGTFFATMSSYSAVSMCASWGGPVAIAFAVVGILLCLIWFFTSDRRSPTEKFLDDKASPAGLRMRGEKQAPEYFNVVPAKEGQPSLVGLSIKGPLLGPKIGETNPDKQQFISLDVVTRTPKLVDVVDYSLDTIWSLETRPNGKSFIYTAALTKGNADADGNAPTIRTLWYLATSDDYAQVELRELPGKWTPEKRDAVIDHFLWDIDVIAKPTLDMPDKRDDKGNITELGHVMSAIVNIYQNGLQLGRWLSLGTMKMDERLTVAASGYLDASFERLFSIGWVMSMAPIGPSEFAYSHPEWKLTELDRDRRNVPHFLLPNASSSGLKWDIQPALDPECFELVMSPGADEGMIRQLAGKKPKVMACTEYTVTCSLLVSGTAVGPRSTKVKIEVSAATSEDLLL